MLNIFGCDTDMPTIIGQFHLKGNRSSGVAAYRKTNSMNLRHFSGPK
jgi:hypothetical protein